MSVGDLAVKALRDKLHDLNETRNRLLELRYHADNWIRNRIRIIRRTGDRSGVDVLSIELIKLEREEALALRGAGHSPRQDPLNSGRISSWRLVTARG